MCEFRLEFLSLKKKKKTYSLVFLGKCLLLFYTYRFYGYLNVQEELFFLLKNVQEELEYNQVSVRKQRSKELESSAVCVILNVNKISL